MAEGGDKLAFKTATDNVLATTYLCKDDFSAVLAERPTPSWQADPDILA